MRGASVMMIAELARPLLRGGARWRLDPSGGRLLLLLSRDIGRGVMIGRMDRVMSGVATAAMRSAMWMTVTTNTTTTPALPPIAGCCEKREEFLIQLSAGTKDIWAVT